MPDATLSDCFVAQTQPNRERWAAENCLRLGYGFYLPEVTETVRLKRGGKIVRRFRNRPLFPGYLFVSSETTLGWYPLLRTLGITGLLQGGGDRPALIRSRELQRIKAFEGVDGRIQLPRKGFRNNDRARITAGAYAGYEGLVQGLSPNERIQILIDYMGRTVPFIVRETDLELVQQAAA